MAARRDIEVVLRPARPEDAAGMAAVHVASWRDTYRGIIPESHLARMSAASRAALWRNLLRKPPPSLVTLLAESDQGVIGIASGLRHQRKVPGHAGELEVLYLLPDWKRRGIGRALVAAFARELADGGARSMIVWVLARNEPARRFYRAIGGVEVTREWEIMGVTPLEKIAYGWSRIEALTIS